MSPTRDDRPPGPGGVTVKRKIPEAPDSRAVGCTLYVNYGEAADQGKHHRLTSGSAVVGRDEDCEICLKDDNVSRRHVEIRIVPTGILARDLGSTNGIEYLGERVEQVVLQPGERILVGRSIIDLLPLTDQNHAPISTRQRYGGLVGISQPMRQVFSILESLENSDAPVLIQGETGTGKELTAHALQQHGRRAQRPFVIIDCSNIPAELMESELFGHTKGAFTGAIADRRGAFETADQGTVFLDEVDDLPLGLQPKLLRVLETGQVRRVGETGYHAIDTRIIATTKRDLTKAIQSGSFRSDLYYRLAVVKIRLPALRERVEDIPVLANHLMEHIVGRPGAKLSPEARDYLMRHRWPGNVRQLRNALERMLALQMESTDDAHQLQLHVQVTAEVPLPSPAELRQLKRSADPGEGAPGPQAGNSPVTPYPKARKEALKRFELTYLEQILARSGNNLSEGARLAGIDRKYLRNLLKKHDLYKP